MALLMGKSPFVQAWAGVPGVPLLGDNSATRQPGIRSTISISIYIYIMRRVVFWVDLSQMFAPPT
jgi:hypothetical protein